MRKILLILIVICTAHISYGQSLTVIPITAQSSAIKTILKANPPTTITVTAFLKDGNPLHILKKWRKAIKNKYNLFGARCPILYERPLANKNHIIVADTTFRIPNGFDNEHLYFFFKKDNDYITLKEASLDSVNLYIENNTTPILKFKINNVAGDDTLFAIDLGHLNNLKQDDRVDIRYVFTTNPVPTTALEEGNTRYYKYSGLWTTAPYGVFNAKTYIWAPTGMFATNFNRSNVGITFAPMPIGGAIGFKINTPDNIYLGISAFASWLLYEEPTNTTSSSNINLQGFTLGGLIDINNYFTVGACYGYNTSTSGKDPKWSFVVGVAPGILNLLKSPSPGK